MDAIFSLPVLSLFLLPVLSSYSTTLNLVFFYMTWTTLVLSHPPLRVEIFATITIRLLFYILPSLGFFLFDILTPSAAVVVKAQGEAGLPGGDRKKKISKREIKVAAWAVGNVVLGIAVQCVVEMIRTRWFGMKSAIKVSMKLPLPWEMVKDLLKALLGREILAYSIHRYILHNPKFPTTTPYKHHQSWYHSLRAPFPLTAHYDHPIIYLLANFIPTYAPAMVFRVHLLTYSLYLTLVSVEETFAYSGYTVMPTRFFLGGIARRVDLHLLSDAEGNFGPWGVMDWACGSAVNEGGEEGEAGDEQAMLEREIDDQVRKAIEASRKRVREEYTRRKYKGKRSVDR